MLGTELCDRCWELEGRIKRDSEIALRIMNADGGRTTELRKALEDLLANHVALVASGDCGNWNVETEPAVIAARVALGKAKI